MNTGTIIMTMIVILFTISFQNIYFWIQWIILPVSKVTFVSFNFLRCAKCFRQHENRDEMQIKNIGRSVVANNFFWTDQKLFLFSQDFHTINCDTLRYVSVILWCKFNINWVRNEDFFRICEDFISANFLHVQLTKQSKFLNIQRIRKNRALKHR